MSLRDEVAQLIWSHTRAASAGPTALMYEAADAVIACVRRDGQTDWRGFAGDYLSGDIERLRAHLPGAAGEAAG